MQKARRRRRLSGHPIATAIILMILALVLAVARAGSLLRHRIHA